MRLAPQRSRPSSALVHLLCSRCLQHRRRDRFQQHMQQRRGRCGCSDDRIHLAQARRCRGRSRGRQLLGSFEALRKSASSALWSNAWRERSVLRYAKDDATKVLEVAKENLLRQRLARIFSADRAQKQPPPRLRAHRHEPNSTARSALREWRQTQSQPGWLYAFGALTHPSLQPHPALGKLLRARAWMQPNPQPRLALDKLPRVRLALRQ
mmetsp:Transcript_144119/g.359312  ORF Transcript_144119/g.359312 Transcript_144119/m.359312 type:complete len:210 (-) Transcript_144119:660-1289(-)